jgi:hypothetical protein
MVAMKRLVTTAKRPDTEIACPAIPSLAPRSAAMGVRRLTGMNSDAISIATQSAIEPTALHAFDLKTGGFVAIVFMFMFSLVQCYG